MGITRWVLIVQVLTVALLVGLLVALYGTFQSAHRLEEARAERNAS